MSHHYDILVVGAGPAGIAAAVSAAGAGRRVGTVDDNPTAGGQIWRGAARDKKTSAAAQWIAKLEAAPVTRLQGHSVFDQPASGVLSVEHQGTCLELHYEQLVLATGARERFLPFPGWTLPNVMGAGALDAMVKGGLPIKGKRVVIAGTGPLLLAVGAHLAEHGAKVVEICEQAPLSQVLSFATQLADQPGKLLQGARYRAQTIGASFRVGCWPVAAKGTDRIGSVVLSDGRREREVKCDYLACGFHLVPNIELAVLMGCSIAHGFVEVDEMQQTSVKGVYCAGEPTGIGGVDLSLIEGQIAGLAAAGRTSAAQSLAPSRRKLLQFARTLENACALRPELRGLPDKHTLVCRCEDVSFGVLRDQTSWRSAKLHTRCGMGPCQGRICGAACEFLFGWGAKSGHSNASTPGELGTTSGRPPVFPALVSSLATAGHSAATQKEAQ